MLSSKPNVTAGIAPGPTCEMPGADGASPAIQNAMDNAVTIEFKVDGKMEVAGSGFWVGGTEGKILATNNHVVKDILAAYPDPKKAEIFVRPCGGDRKGELIAVKVGERDPGNDLALLTSEKPTDYSGLTIAPEGSADLGETVWTLGGIGGVHYRCVLDKGSIAALEPDHVHGWHPVPDKESVIIVDGNINPGNSGSAVIDALGRVIGVAFATVLSAGVGFIIKSEKLTPLVERQQAILENSMANEPTEEELSAWFMDVEELLELDSKGMEQYLDAVIRDAHLRSGDMEAEAILRDLEVAHLEMNPNMPILPGDSPLPGTQGTQIDDFAVGDAFARLVTGDPGSLGGLPGSIGGPIGGIEVEPELGFGPGFDVPLA